VANQPFQTVSKALEKEKEMAQAILSRDAGAAFTLDVYWWELFIAYARSKGWVPQGWEPPMLGTQQIPADEAARLTAALEQVRSGPPPADQMSQEDLDTLISFLSQGGFTLEIHEARSAPLGAIESHR
jgi:hypothetical protein